MKNVLLDSSAWIEFFTNGSATKNVEKYFNPPFKIFLSVVVIYEVFKWVKRQAGEAEAMLIAGQMERLAEGIIEINRLIAIQSADISLQYKIPMADALIYASALASDSTVVTKDIHFSRLPQVEMISSF